MKKTLTYSLLTLASVFWGVSFILTKQIFLTEASMTVTLLIALRLLLASAVTFPLLAAIRQLEPIRKGDLKWFLILALAEPFVYHLFETSGVRLVSGSLSSVVIATIPLFVPFGMAAAYRERLTWPLLVGVVMSLVGVATMLVGEEGGFAVGSSRGLLFLAGAVVTAVVYTLLLVRVVNRYRPATITAWQNLFGLAYFVILLTVENALPSAAFSWGTLGELSWSWGMMWPLLTLGLFCSTFAYMFYNLGVKELGASRACIFNNTIPIFSFIAAIAIGQETFSWAKLAGMAIVIAGVFISQRPEKR